MTLTRLSLLALALTGLTIAACGKDDTGDTGDTPEGDADADTDADTDTDTDTDTDVNYFEPYAFAWTFQGGIIGGVPATVSSSHGDIPPIFQIELYEVEYTNDFDDRYKCTIQYEAGGEPGDASAKAFMDLYLDLAVPYDTDCENLDENVWGPDPYAIFGNDTWELAWEAADQDLVDTITHYIGEDKWEEGWEPWTTGVQTFRNGTAMHSMHTAYGIAYPLDGTALDESAKEPLTVKELAMGVDGFYMATPMYIWFFQ